MISQTAFELRIASRNGIKMSVNLHFIQLEFVLVPLTCLSEFLNPVSLAPLSVVSVAAPFPSADGTTKLPLDPVMATKLPQLMW